MIFHRIESPTQTAADAIAQERTNEIWGRESRYSDVPRVKAYVGQLPRDKRGIEFDTDVSPDGGSPPGQATWTGPRVGVVVEAGFAKVSVRWVKNFQR